MNASAVAWGLIFLLLPLERLIEIPGQKISWNALLILFFLALCFLYADHWRADRGRLTGWMAAGLLSLVLLASFITGEIDITSVRATTSILMVIWSAPLLHQFIRHQRDLAVALLVMSITFHAIWGLAQFSFQSDLNLHHLGETRIEIGQSGLATFTSWDGAKIVRAYGPYPHPNILGGSAVLGLVALVHHHYRRGEFPHVVASTLSYFMSLAALLTFSRAAWIGAGLLLLVSYCTKTIVVRVFFVFIIILVCMPLIVMRFTDTQDRAVAERLMSNRNAQAMLRQVPLWHGVGPGNYERALTQYLNAAALPYELWHIAPVHNVVLLLLVEWGGIPVLISAAWLVVRYARQFRRTWLYLLPIIPLVLFDHYVVTQTAPLMYVVAVVLLLAEGEASPLSASAFRQATNSRPQPPQ